MEYSAQERFFRRLNPEHHFTSAGPGTFRVNSAAFKGIPRNVSGLFVTSVDAERLISLTDERQLAQAEHPGFGIGAISYGAIVDCGARVVYSPTERNPAHHDILSPESQSRKLARATEVIEWPAAPIADTKGTSHA